MEKKYSFLFLILQSYKSNVPVAPVEKLTEQEREDQLECYTTMMYTMSKFEDWRAHLAQLLQSVPFPDQSLVHSTFTSYAFCFERKKNRFSN